MSFVKQTLFKIARSPAAAPLVGYSFAHLTRWMPVDRIYEDDDIFVFHHPVPSWETHILLVPKQRVKSLTAAELTPTLFFKIFFAAQNMARVHGLSAYSLLVNGGGRQDVPQLHFHLAIDSQFSGLVFERPESGEGIKQLGNWFAYPHPHPRSGYHMLLAYQDLVGELPDLPLGTQLVESAFASGLEAVRHLITRDHLKAYSLLVQVGQGAAAAPFHFHLIQ